MQENDRGEEQTESEGKRRGKFDRARGVAHSLIRRTYALNS